ncbi:putative motility protein [Roseateles sp.]|uniref:putative motility protein n=1 Tax=Roseateles sp. TaxID=1971397 RepID=UPI0025DD1E09|nr:putative motility protein [Roseateles sp.]MBV8034040.1 putative motility protein [Roseateles sp.]
MDIANSTSVNVASRYAQADTADAVNLLVLRKAIDVQAAGALALLSALPQQPALATEGSLGRHVNTYA